MNKTLEREVRDRDISGIKRWKISREKYYWTRKEEARLLDLWKKGVTNMDILAREIGRTPSAIRKKLKRMGVVVGPKTSAVTTTAIESKDLWTHEEALKVLVGALETLRKPGLDKLEITRLRALIDAAKTYDSLLEKFERWVEIENRLLEMDKKIVELTRSKKAKDIPPS